MEREKHTAKDCIPCMVRDRFRREVRFRVALERIRELPPGLAQTIAADALEGVEE